MADQENPGNVGELLTAIAGANSGAEAVGIVYDYIGNFSRPLHVEISRNSQTIAAQAARIAELEKGINSANTAAAHYYEKLTANNEVYRAELSASQAQNAVLREALETVKASRYLHFCANPDCKSGLCQDKRKHVASIGTALAATPAASLAMVKAGALREAASKLEPKFGTIISCGDLLDMADQLEAAAKGEGCLM